MRLGIPELLVILAIVILIFGASRLPELGRGIGKGIKNFKDATQGRQQDRAGASVAIAAPAVRALFCRPARGGPAGRCVRVRAALPRLSFGRA